MASQWRNKLFETSKFQFKKLIPEQKNNKTYIIPTKFGFCFSAVLLVLLYSAFASGNNLLYLYTFFLTSLGVTSLWLTHVNIADIKVDSFETEEIFADSPAFSLVNIYNNSSNYRHFIGIYHSKEKIAIIPEIPAKSFYQTRIELGTYTRGSHAMPTLQLNTTFPFFLLNSWKVFRPKETFIVFPKREGNSHLPLQGHQQDNDEGRIVDPIKGTDFEFAGHRKFNSGDSMRQVDWKAYARTERMLIKDYQGYQPPEIELRWQSTSASLTTEARLSQLALWIEISESKGFRYSLDLPGEHFKSHRGRTHYLTCLKSLALFNKDKVSEA